MPDTECLSPVLMLMCNYSLSPFRLSCQLDPHAVDERNKNLTHMTTRWEIFMQLNQPLLSSSFSSTPWPVMTLQMASWLLVKVGEKNPTITHFDKNKEDPNWEVVRWYEQHLIQFSTPEKVAFSALIDSFLWNKILQQKPFHSV